MKQKKYDSVQYVAQELRISLERTIKETSGGEITITHTYNPKTEESTISYNLFQLQAELTIQKEEEGFYLTQTNKHKSLEHKTKEKLKLKRSKARRLSKDNMDKLAKKSLQSLKDFYRKGSK
ncbi:hypothetical protein HOE04_03585 [archaeon]|jgi:hypothetical protein|nr:hypothetical protein [archaeon]